MNSYLKLNVSYNLFKKQYQTRPKRAKEGFLELIRNFYLTHSPLNCIFNHSADDFTVTEIPLYAFSGDGEHLILTVRKKNISTWDMLAVLASALNIKQRDIGYAGLKDKNAMTVQHISVHRSCEARLENFEHAHIKILNKTYHKNKIKLGHLKGNKFFVRLKKVLAIDRQKIDAAVQKIQETGLPNFFGYQRFGANFDNHEKGLDLIARGARARTREEKFYISAYQSALFNGWLSKRLELSHLAASLSEAEFRKIFAADVRSQGQFFKLLSGDLMSHYPFGKLFWAQDLTSEAQKFAARDRVPTGLLSGRAMFAKDAAWEIEKEFSREMPNANGDRRFAWIFPEITRAIYKEEKAHYELEFFLPKGSYATVLIEEILHRKFEK